MSILAAATVPYLNELLKQSSLSILEPLRQAYMNRLLEYQVQEYKKACYAKTILHRTTPKLLDEFYQPLFIKGQNDLFEKGELRVSTQNIKLVFGHGSYLTILGSAGSGKSTLIKYLYKNTFETKFGIPIRLDLRYINDFAGSIYEYIVEHIFKFHSLGIDEGSIKRLLSKNDFVFFFDGYDEVTLSRKSIIAKELSDFVDRFPANKYIVTSRPHTGIEQLPLFKNYDVCDLEGDEIPSFIRKQIPLSETEVANKIISAVDKESNASYRQFLSNPLLLSMFILTFQTYAEIPAKRSEFYNQVYDTLYSTHDSISKMGYNREKSSGLGKSEMRDILQKFCYKTFLADQY